jgi:hypothetical protein
VAARVLAATAQPSRHIDMVTYYNEVRLSRGEPVHKESSHGQCPAYDAAEEPIQFSRLLTSSLHDVLTLIRAGT